MARGVGCPVPVRGAHSSWGALQHHRARRRRRVRGEHADLSTAAPAHARPLRSFSAVSCGCLKCLSLRGSL